MSPELTFLLSLILRMVVAAAFVVIASMVTERSGPAIGALIATLPVSAGPSYIFLALDHDAAFVAQSALASLPMNAASTFMGVTYVLMAQRYPMVVTLAAAFAVWVIFALLVSAYRWSLAAGIALNVLAFVVCLPLVGRYRGEDIECDARRSG